MTRSPRSSVALAALATVLASTLLALVPGATPASAAPVGTIVNHGQHMQGPWEVVAGPDGAMWFTNFTSSTIGRSTTAGVVTRYTGAGISLPTGIAVGSDGALWFANEGSGGSIGRITTAGVVSNFDDATITSPKDIAAGADGALWFTNYNNDSIVRITTAGVVTSHTNPGIDGPQGITAGPDGNLWFSSSLNNSVGRITTAGVVTMFSSAGINSPWGITAGPDGNLWVANFGGPLPNTIGRMTPAGGYTSFEVEGFPLGASQITSGPDGNLWFTSTFGEKVGRITTAGVVTDFGGLGAKTPRGIAAGPDGNLWFASFATDWLGRMTTAGVITNVPGTTIARPYGIVRGSDGNMWFGNSNGASIGRITSGGTISSFTTAGLLRPFGVAAGPDGNVWFVDNAANKVGRITTAGVITLYNHASINQPHGITAGPDGALWFTNIGTGTIGRITTSGAVTNFTGAGISQPQQITTGPDGALWFTNRGNASIGRITTAGVITNFTGTGINGPYGIATGSDGNVWFTNSYGNSVGRITPAGVVSNFPVAWANVPYDLAAGPDGNLWFTSYNNNSVGRITTAGVTTQYQDARSRGPMGIANGGDGTMWFTNQINWSIAQITAADLAVPGAPTGTSAVAGKQRATVSWTAPASNGGSPITGYAVTAAPGGATCTTTGALTCTVTGLTAGTPYSFTVRATNAIGQGPASVVSAAVVPWDGSGYHAVTPERILDSRLVNKGFAGKVVSPTSRSLQVTGLGGGSNVPASATAVVMNVTVAEASSESFLTVYPTGTVKPNASNLNFGAGQIIPNLVTVKVGTGGKVEFANAVGGTHVIADVVGYYDDGTGPGDLFTGITPVRLLDSRTTTGGWSGPLPAGSPRDLVVRKPGNGLGVPATATAVVANVTVTGGTAQSFVSVWPSGQPQPNVSNLNLMAGQTIPNLVTVKIGTGGAIRVANAVGDVDVIVDVVGYFDPTTGSRFHAINPTRFLDTRVPTGLAGPQQAGETRNLGVAGMTGTNVPAGATALVANVTVADGLAESFVSVFPGNVARPDPFSNLNFGKFQVIPNLAVVGLAPNGSVNFYNHLGKVALIGDAVGYYAAS